MNNESTLFNDIPPVKGIRPSNGVYCSQGSMVFIFDAGGYFI
jgi:hypothetical protein